MLTIALCEDKKTIQSFCKKCKRPFSEALYMYIAKDGETILGSALFEVCSDSVQVVLYDAEDQEDFFLLDGILRAGLNFAALQGIENGHIPEQLRQEHRNMFQRLNYPIQPVFNITNFFSKYKNCK